MQGHARKIGSSISGGLRPGLPHGAGVPTGPQGPTIRSGGPNPPGTITDIVGSEPNPGRPRDTFPPGPTHPTFPGFPNDPGPQTPISGGMPQPQAPTTAAVAGGEAPLVPQVNPYTGQPLGANEYVGVAGSEAEHPGMKRIPPPGWWDPSNANYERRSYYVGPNGQIIAREAGFRPGEEDPYDTGRQDEINAEFEGRPGFTSVFMDEPGVTPWHRGEKRPEMAKYTPWSPGGVAQGAGITEGSDVLSGLSAPANNPQASAVRGYDPTSELMAALAALRGRIPAPGGLGRA